MAGESLRERRSALLGRGLRGRAFCLAYAQAADEWLVEIATAAGGTRPDGVALVAVGGYGRGLLAPFSDLDLVLVHGARRKVGALADRLWYPIWDEGVRLDHSVRSVRDLGTAGDGDLRVALGLLDARLVWGDPTLLHEASALVESRWQDAWSTRWLPELRDQSTSRHDTFGYLADLIEPNVKESFGGLRDVTLISALDSIDGSARADRTAVALAEEVLLETRVAMHALAGREQDQLLLQEQDAVAPRMGASDAYEMMRGLSAAARIVRRALERRWRGRTKPTVDTVSPDDRFTFSGDGTVVLGPNAELADPAMPLLLATTAASAGLAIDDDSLALLRDVTIPHPWSAAVRDAFLGLLGSGSGVVDAVETLDDAGLFERYLPEWAAVRHFHQRNAYHRFTVDRHLLEAVAIASTDRDSVRRPDLLLLGALCHDIGKGRGGDHTAMGVELVQAMGPRMGLSDEDSATLAQLVRHHLLLPDAATRRDLDDPATAEFVASALGDEETLELLAALARADGEATGPSAWSPWKAQLVRDLVERVRRVLRGHDHSTTESDDVELVTLARSAGLVVRRQDDWLTVATPDQPALLATIAAVLAAHGLSIRSADVFSHGDVAVDRFLCHPGPRGWPTDATLTEALAAGFKDPATAQARLAERSAAAPPRRQSAHPTPAQVRELPAASQRATVLEVVAPDRIGLLSDLAAAVAASGADIAAARLSTVGDVAIDAFYLRDRAGRTLGSAALADVVARLTGVIGGQPSGQ